MLSKQHYGVTVGLLTDPHKCACGIVMCFDCLYMVVLYIWNGSLHLMLNVCVTHIGY